MCAERVAISVLMSLVFLFFVFFFFFLFWSMAGLNLCQCLEALILHRIIQMPNSLKRDSNLSVERERKRERERNTIFLYFYLRCRGTNR